MKTTVALSCLLAAVLAGLFFLFGQNEASLHGYNHPQNHDTLFVLAGTTVVAIALAAVFFSLLTRARAIFWAVVGSSLAVTLLLFFFSSYQLEPPTSLQWKGADGGVTKESIRRLPFQGGELLGVELNGPQAGQSENDLLVRFPRPVQAATFAFVMPEWTGPVPAAVRNQTFTVGFYRLDPPREELGRTVLTPARMEQPGAASVVIRSPTGFSGLEVRSLPDPTAAVGSVYLSFHQAEDSRIALGRFGHIWLQALVVAGFAALLLREFFLLARDETFRSAARTVSPWTLLAIFAGFDLLLVGWLGMTHNLWTWDWANYPDITRALATTFEDRGLAAALNNVVFTLREDYNAVPTLPIVPLAVLFHGEGSRALFLAAVGTLYAVPAFLALAYLAWFWGGRGLSFAAVLGLTVVALFFFPIVFYPVFYGFPDIGGVLFAALILVFLFRHDAEPGALPGLKSSLTLLTLGGLLVLLVLFRRWYLFLLPPLVTVIALRQLFLAYRARLLFSAGGWVRALTPLFVMGCFMGLVVAVFYSERIAIILSINYGNAYARYWPGRVAELVRQFATIGFVPALATVAGWLYLARGRETRVWAWSALVFVVAVYVAFFRVQGFSPQHYFLTVPVYVVLVVIALQRLLARHPGRDRWIVGGFLLLAAAATFSTLRDGGFPARGPSLFPRAISFVPLQRHDIPVFEKLAGDLARAAQDGHHFCMISLDVSADESTLTQAALRLPPAQRNSFEAGKVFMPTDDFANGPDLLFPQADLVAVGSPLPADGAPSQQTLYYLAKCLLDQTGLGLSYRRLPGSYPIDGGTVVLFERQAPIPPDEWQKYIAAVLKK